MSTDERIISHLRKNSRTSLVNIAKSLEMPVSTVYDKINRMQRDKLIKKHTTLIDFQKLGFNHQIKFVLKVNRLQKNDFLLFLQNHSNVNSIYEINSDFDFLIETFHKDIKEYLAFVEKIKEIFDIYQFQEFQIINEVEREKLLTKNHSSSSLSVKELNV